MMNPFQKACRYAVGLFAAFALTTHVASAWDASAFEAEALGDVKDLKPLLIVRITTVYGCHLGLVNPGVAPGLMSVMVDAKPDAEYEGILNRTPVFSSNGKHFAYGARKGEQWFVVADGKAGPKWDMILEGSLIFSEEGQHLAYVAKKGRQWFVVIDDKISAPYDEISCLPMLSKDGQHVVYGAQNKKRQFMVFDENPGPEYDYAVSVNISPDGKRVAHGAQQDSKQFVVVDGKAQSDFEEIAKNTLVMSSDGMRVAYGALKNGKYKMVIDGKTSGEYDAVGVPSFSPDGKHVTYRAGKNEQAIVFVDGDEVPNYIGIVCEPVFRKDGVLEFMTAEKGILYRITSKAFLPTP